MKKVNGVFIIILLMLSGCGGKQTKDDLAFIDVRKNYPEKEILLTDIASITYLYLNSDNNDYLYKGRIHSITENTVVVVDDVSGSILFFSKDGTPKSHFNRKGQGPEEYTSVFRLFYDEKADDVYVIDGRGNHIQVYSSTGTSKRKITLPQGTRVGNDIISFDDSSFFFYDPKIEIKLSETDKKNLTESDWNSPFYRISKIDGAILDYLELPMAPIVLEITYDGMRVAASPLCVSGREHSGKSC